MIAASGHVKSGFRINYFDIYYPARICFRPWMTPGINDSGHRNVDYHTYGFNYYASPDTFTTTSQPDTSSQGCLSSYALTYREFPSVYSYQCTISVINACILGLASTPCFNIKVNSAVCWEALLLVLFSKWITDIALV